jgi:hypothetical protein
MNIPTTVFIVLSVAAAIVIYARNPVRAWRRYRGVRIVICPETQRPAAVSFDTGHAALTALVEDQAELRLAACSRWPERGPCSEPCLPDVQAAGSAGTVHAVVEEWYATQRCAYCWKPITDAGTAHHQPALRASDGITVQWSDVPPEQLPDLFHTHQPVCWNCHIAETFRRLHPDLAVQRSPALIDRSRR